MSGFATSAFLGALPWTAAAVAAVMVVTFVVSLRVGRADVVDVAWGLLFVAVALTATALGAGHGDGVRRALVAAMVTLWGVRLAVHIGRRAAGRGPDPRYEALLRRGHRNPTVNAVLKVFLPQAVLAWLISAPVQVAAFEPGAVGVVGGAGVAVWGLGLVFEAVGDAQLARYRAWRREQPPEAVRDSVMDRGLWAWTRHPNYFGDACVWVGLFLVAAEHLPGLLTLPAVALMVFLLVGGSGKANLERSMVQRPGYREYMARTSGFVPLPPRRRR